MLQHQHQCPCCSGVPACRLYHTVVACRSIIDSVVQVLENIQCPDFLSFLCDLVSWFKSGVRRTCLMLPHVFVLALCLHSCNTCA